MRTQEIAALILAGMAAYPNDARSLGTKTDDAIRAARQIQTEMTVSGTEFVKMQTQLKDIELKIRDCMSDPSAAIMQILRR